MNFSDLSEPESRCSAEVLPILSQRDKPDFIGPPDENGRPLYVTIKRRGYPFSFGELRKKANSKEWFASHYLYVVGCHDLGRYKIGMTNEVQKRFEAIQACSPVELTLYGSFQVRKIAARWIEMAAHKKLWQCRVHGEWFECSHQAAVGSVKSALHWERHYLHFIENQLWLTPEWKAAERFYKDGRG